EFLFDHSFQGSQKWKQKKAQEGRPCAFQHDCIELSSTPAAIRK
ncbi:hypothetical protein HOLDEFILI_00759, partial [Holdemania filiformis DSM 12042]